MTDRHDMAGGGDTLAFDDLTRDRGRGPRLMIQAFLAVSAALLLLVLLVPVVTVVGAVFGFMVAAQSAPSGFRPHPRWAATMNPNTAPTTVTTGTSRTSNSNAAETARKAWIINRGPRPRSRVRSSNASGSTRRGAWRI